ncbi:phosphatase PAP2 family protein [Belliella kenyensis]|uniref:Phosphatase PAP2 family protein n=1 Tax=Belliella kenyensis TaxID=1472724 RepID=A0ABV8EKV5_9BACT|nr:phosphatase PAP2 family protein [Belliella kenyensis]MCH7403235.1 phosphatase PAP2 family protein [Belliella kenyensis]MDN3604846.1 phosphatase PAP2 family protein [Belliella kenyensis]
MLETIKNWDESLFIYLNSFHDDFFDPIIFQLTHTWPWIPLYILLLILILKTHGRASWWVLISLALTILIADQFTSGFMKPFFERLRPCHDPKWEGIVHNFGRCGGQFGFASSHASNSFAIATFMMLSVGKKYPKIKWLLLWAFFFSYTRVYLGVHYPADIIVGGLVGILSAWLAYHAIHTVYLQYIVHEKDQDS